MHGTHSPFVYQLLEEVIYKKGSYYNYDKVANLRSKSLRDKRTIKVIDLGAGSKKLNHQRKINQIAREPALKVNEVKIKIQTMKLITGLSKIAIHFLKSASCLPIIRCSLG